MITVLGISAFYHDSAAALVQDGKIIAAAQEERFSRKKHDSSYPFHSIEYVLKEASLNLNEIDYIAFYEKPFLKFERILETYLSFIPKGFRYFKTSMPLWLKEKIFQKELIKNYLFKIDNSFNKNNILPRRRTGADATAARYGQVIGGRRRCRFRPSRPTVPSPHAGGICAR